MNFERRQSSFRGLAVIFLCIGTVQMWLWTSALKPLPRQSTERKQEQQPQLHDPPRVPNATVIKGVELNECYVRANDRIRNETKIGKEQQLPLFASIVQTPARKSSGEDQPETTNQSSIFYWTAHFSLCQITWNQNGGRGRIEKWSDAIWQCDGHEAMVVDRGDLDGLGLSIQCPQTDPNHVITTITVRNYTYYVRDYVECERKNPLNKPAPDTKLGAAVMIYQMDTVKGLEWIEYHRLIGVQHFFLYVMDDKLQGGWPDLSYITYVPFHLDPDMANEIDIFSFQTSAQVDMLHRGRALGIYWITYNDMDEFIVPRCNNHTLPSYLADHFNDEIPGIQLQTTTFGNPPGTDGEPRPQMLDYIWRTNLTFGPDGRVKCIVRPTHVNYYKIHLMASYIGEPYLVDINDIWIHHYKKARYGIFLGEIWEVPHEIIMDTTVRDRYSTIVATKVEDILSRMTDL
jgi:hypothetical protein